MQCNTTNQNLGNKNDGKIDKNTKKTNKKQQWVVKCEGMADTCPICSFFF